MYHFYIGCFLASLYVFAPQGRPQAIEKMTYKAFMKFWNNNIMPLSRSFKTSSKYSIQVITIGKGHPESLLQIYIDVLRPTVLRRREDMNIDNPDNSIKITFI